MSDFKKVAYWQEMAEYDLATAKAMLETKRYLYVAFMCHQAIEKILKAVIVAKEPENLPYIHQLIKLAKIANIYHEFSDDQKDLLDELSPLNVGARYPVDKEAILKSLNQERCSMILKRTEALFEWIKAKL
ncbi:MAG: HEPN domain-containing protein [Bacillota bacterium]|nr:HEPN domain-containing protein [Bacillota bacterium]